MKIRKEVDYEEPIYMMAGDSIELSHDIDGRRQVVLTETVTSPMAVDYAAVFDLAPQELAALGLADAIGGLFGKRAA